MERRRYHLHRRTCPHHTKHEGSEPDYGGIRRYCPQQYPVDTCLEPTGHTLRGDRSTLQAEQGYPRAVRTAQHDKRRIPDNKASHGTQGKRRTALHDRLSARQAININPLHHEETIFLFHFFVYFLKLSLQSDDGRQYHHQLL